MNSEKTELCIFHRNDVKKVKIILDNVEIASKQTIKILGVTFDSKLNWSPHVNLAIQRCKKNTPSN